MTPTFIELFCGAGGLSLGLRRAGWRPLLALDNWADAVETYRANLAGGGEVVLEDDIGDLTKAKLHRLLPARPNWVLGGPPCQGFSTVGKRERTDPRNMLVKEFARIVQLLRPDGFLMENVIGLRDMRFVEFVCGLFPDYQVTNVVVVAADYGIPQLRRRIFFVGDLRGRVFNKPVPIHAPHEYVSVWDAIGDLPALQPGEIATTYDKPAETAYQRQLRHGSKELQGHQASNHPAHLLRAISYIPDGGNRRSIPARFQPKSGFHNSYSRLDSKAPAVAVTQNMGKPSATRCIHPFQHRGLTAREGARLQGFPDTFHFRSGVCPSGCRLQMPYPPFWPKCLRTLSSETIIGVINRLRLCPCSSRPLSSSGRDRSERKLADTVSRSKRSAIMAAVPNRNTQPEKLVRSCLFRAGFRYRLHVRGLPGSPDIVLPRYRAVVFVHGCFWHGHGCNRAKLPNTNVTYWKQKIQRNGERDRKHREALENIDWRVFTIWTCTLRTDLAETVHALQTLRLRIGVDEQAERR